MFVTDTVQTTDPMIPATSPWLEEAWALKEQLLNRVQPTRKGHLVWLTADQNANKLGPHLYSGFTGIALFLAAYSHCSDGVKEGRLALQILAPLRRQLRRLVDIAKLAEERRFMLGSLVGLGSYIYTFSKVGQWLGEDELIADAHRISNLITREQIVADAHLDIAQGSAGALLTLLALDRIRPEANASGTTPLELATACGDHLLAQRIVYEGRSCAWRVNGKSPGCGFAHGATGIAYALLALAKRTGRCDFRDTAHEGLAFERTLFDPRRGAWQVSEKVGNFWMSWCNGTAGVALGRLAMLQLDDDPQIIDEARTALTTLRNAPPTSAEHLCCGNLGRAEVFREAARLLGEKIFLTEAEAVANAALTRSRDRDREYTWDEFSDSYGFEPSFFLGSAGAGYAALRCADPSLPCVLRME